MTAQLPEGWGIAPIGSVARVVGGGTPPSHDPDNFAPVGNGVPWVTPADLSGYRSQSISRGARDLSETGLARCGATLMPKGTVLFSSRAPIGYVAIAANEISTNQGFKSFVLPAEIDPRFVYWQLKHLKPEAEAIATGTTFKELSGAAAATLPLRIAPLPEQTRIADQLDSLLARIQACQDRLEAIPALLKRFRQAVLNSAVSGTLIDVEGGRGAAAWERTTVGAIARDVRYGTSKKCTYASTGHGVLRIPNIAQHGTIDLTDLKRADFDAKEVDKLALQEGDLLVIRSNGSLELVGACSVVTTAEAGLLFAGYLMRLRIDQTKALPAFVRICLSTSRQRELIERTAKSTSGVNNLNAEELRSLPLSLPTVGEQIAIVKRVEALLGLAARIERRHAAAASNALRLTPLTLAKAFRGELVPQDPSDESASALLARIAAQRDAPTDTTSASTPRRGRSPRAPKETAAMTKSRQDDDVMGQPYLAGHLRRIGTPASAEALFKVAELPVADFYKQLAWEVDQGHVKDNQATLEPGHAAG
ncbi:MAG: restriction endonuclease subunit S [Rhodocyclaceae bacterium]|nr:restriction endonuclease subunit S [Rhodocyclaceae bacterium]